MRLDFPPSIPRTAEFIQLLSSEANEVSTREKKNTIQPEHVMAALSDLGFSDFVAEVTAAWDQQKEEAKGERWGVGGGRRRLYEGQGTPHTFTPYVFSIAATSSHKAALRKTGADQAGYTEEEQVRGHRIGLCGRCASCGF